MRGSNTFVTMKGFEPVLKEADVTDSDKLTDLAKDSGPKKGPKGADNWCMAPNAKMVADKAKGDIADGYVADVQTGRKGYERYNEMVSKGMAADIEINEYNVAASLDSLTAHSGMVIKELGSGIEIKALISEEEATAYEKAHKERKPSTYKGPEPANASTVAPKRDVSKTVGQLEAEKGTLRKVGDWAKRNKKVLIPAGVAAGVGAAGLGGYALYKNSQKNKGFEDITIKGGGAKVLDEAEAAEYAAGHTPHNVAAGPTNYKPASPITHDYKPSVDTTPKPDVKPSPEAKPKGEGLWKKTKDVAKRGAEWAGKNKLATAGIVGGTALAAGGGAYALSRKKKAANEG